MRHEATSKASRAVSPAGLIRLVKRIINGDHETEIAANKHDPQETLCLAELRELALRESRILVS